MGGDAACWKTRLTRENWAVEGSASGSRNDLESDEKGCTLASYEIDPVVIMTTRVSTTSGIREGVRWRILEMVTSKGVSAAGGMRVKVSGSVAEGCSEFTEMEDCERDRLRYTMRRRVRRSAENPSGSFE